MDAKDILNLKSEIQKTRFSTKNVMGLEARLRTLEAAPPGSAAWGSIAGTLANQTDLNSALAGKQASLGFTAVPTTRTINSLDLSTNRTLTLASCTEDATHRVVTDTEKGTWNGKQAAITFSEDPTEYLNGEGAFTVPAGGAGGSARAMNDGRIVRTSDTVLTWEGYSIGLYNPAAPAWVEVIPSSAPTLANTANDLDAAALTYNIPYDIFAEYSSGTAFNLVAKKWTSDSAQAVVPALWEGRYCYDNTTDNGKKRLWLGTVRLRNDGGTAKFTDSVTQAFVSNFYNPDTIQPYQAMSGNSWVYASVWRQANGDAANKVEVLLCRSTPIEIRAKHSFFSTNQNTNGETGVGIDSTSVNSAQLIPSSGWQNPVAIPSEAVYIGTLAAGYHQLVALERSEASLNCTFGSYGKGGIYATYRG